MQLLVEREPITRNDIGAIEPDQVPGFHAWLRQSACITKDGNQAGQFFHVKTALGWAPVQRGAGGKVVTPIALRAVIEDYLACRPATSLSGPGNLILLKPAAAANGTLSLVAEKAPAAIAGTRQVLRLPASKAIPTLAPEVDQLYLDDLRDDFAVHAYLPMFKNEPPADYALRRWQYAELMVQLRPTPGRG